MLSTSRLHGPPLSSTLRKADAYSKVIRTGGGRGKDRAGAQRSLPTLTMTVASPARRTTIREPHNLMEIESVSGDLRGKHT